VAPTRKRSRGESEAEFSKAIIQFEKEYLGRGQNAVAERVHNAWLRTLEDGIHTADIYDADSGFSKQCVGTADFATAVIERLGQQPQVFAPVSYAAQTATPRPVPTLTRSHQKTPAKKELVGVDIFLDWAEQDVDALAARLQRCQTNDLHLLMISNRGQKVWPNGHPETFVTDHWRCRFMAAPHKETIRHRDIIELLERLDAADLDFIKSEHLCTFDGVQGFTVAQGQ
jgi:isocitrate dehydrogenase